MCPSSTHGGVPAKSAETHVLTFIWLVTPLPLSPFFFSLYDACIKMHLTMSPCSAVWSEAVSFFFRVPVIPLRRYAANKTCMRDVASRFDMSESTVYRVLQRVAEFLMTLGPSVISFPQTWRTWLEVLRRFVLILLSWGPIILTSQNLLMIPQHECTFYCGLNYTLRWALMKTW